MTKNITSVHWRWRLVRKKKKNYIYCFKQRGGSGPRPRVEQTPHTPKRNFLTKSVFPRSARLSRSPSPPGSFPPSCAPATATRSSCSVSPHSRCLLPRFSPIVLALLMLQCPSVGPLPLASPRCRTSPLPCQCCVALGMRRIRSFAVACSAFTSFASLMAG